jgi:hypothetical protein
MAEQNPASRGAGLNYELATGLSSEDARNALKYVLLRLSSLGLTAEDQQELRELARLAFSDLDPKEVADRITNTSPSPLAVAIAEIVQRCGETITSAKMAMLGAVFGAYATLSAGHSDDGSQVVLAATAGAVALSTSEFLENMNHKDDWMNFVQRD